MKVSYCSFLKSKAGCVMMVVYFMKLPVLSHTAPFQIFLSPVFLGSQIIHTLRLSSHIPSDIEPLYHLLYVYYLFVYRGIPPKKFDDSGLHRSRKVKMFCFPKQFIPSLEEIDWRNFSHFKQNHVCTHMYYTPLEPYKSNILWLHSGDHEKVKL